MQQNLPLPRPQHAQQPEAFEDAVGEQHLDNGGGDKYYPKEKKGFVTKEWVEGEGEAEHYAAQAGEKYTGA